MWNPYSEMKSKLKKNYDNTIHVIELTNILLSMFEYKNLPETLPYWLIETMLITTGSCGVTEIDGNLYTGTGGFCGNVKNFLPTEYQITNTGVGSKRGFIGETFAVGYNNSSIAPDFYLMQVADILTEIDVSERCNLLYTRLLRIPKVDDNKEKAAVEDCIKAVMEGKFTAMTYKTTLQKLVDNNGDDNFLDLTEVSEIDKLQYLNQYRDNILKRFYQTYGQGMQTTAKLAQQTTDELHGSDTVAMIQVLDRLNCRKRLVDDINRIFGTNITVDFSECWKDSREQMQEFNTDGTIESDNHEEV